MTIRSIPDTFAPPAVSAIDSRLDDIRRQHRVAIPLAVESGSRAWGFPSPDSDYDCRFVFVRPIEQALTPWPLRDVIELPIEGDIDVNGWELGKALKLLVKGNAVIVEWLTSPIAYHGEPWFRTAMLDLAHRHSPRNLLARHYLNLGREHLRRHLSAGMIPQKKLFYALRPAAALRWLRSHPGENIVPMHFPTLMRECDPPPDVTAIVSDLLARKAESRELGQAPVPPALHSFMTAVFDAEESTATRTESVGASAKADAIAFYREATLRCFATEAA